MPRELSQNLKVVLQEVGEGATLLRLSIALYDNPLWRVYRNYAEDGCDIVILGPNQMIKVEVKTRQNIITANPDRRGIHFTLTEKEKEAADFVIAYWFDRSAFFVVPTSQLSRVRSNDKLLYKFIPYFSEKDGDYTAPSKLFHERWDLILEKTKNG
jgi:hypothetical protein